MVERPIDAAAFGGASTAMNPVTRPSSVTWQRSLLSDQRRLDAVTRWARALALLVSAGMMLANEAAYQDPMLGWVRRLSVVYLGLALGVLWVGRQAWGERPARLALLSLDLPMVVTIEALLSQSPAVHQAHLGLAVAELNLLGLMVVLTLEGWPQWVGVAATALASMAILGTAGPQAVLLVHGASTVAIQAGFSLFLILTRRKQLERALDDLQRWERMQKEVLATRASVARLIDASPEKMVVYRDGLVVKANPAFVSFLGLSPSAQFEAVGKPLSDLVGPDGLPGPECRLRRRDGREVLVEVVTLQMEYDGQPATATLLRDLTELRRAQSWMMTQDRLATIGQLSAGIAHEVSNPLGFVRANLGFVSASVRDAMQGAQAPQATAAALAEISEALKESDEGVGRIDDIVQSIKLLSRGLDLPEAPVAVARVLESAAKLARGEISTRAVLELSLEPVPFVLGTEGGLGQVVLNLLVNAMQAIPAGHPQSHRIGLSCKPDVGGGVVIRVSDTGAGIPPEVRARLFEPFFTTKPAGVGTGLGLSICMTIVTQMRGRIDVESEPGKGTAFLIRLPPLEATNPRQTVIRDVLHS
jgi:signal transduction histidine kinase